MRFEDYIKQVHLNLDKQKKEFLPLKMILGLTIEFDDEFQVKFEKKIDEELSRIMVKRKNHQSIVWTYSIVT